MNPAHLHLLVNHLPIMGGFFSSALLLIALLKKSDLLLQTALFFFLFTALSAFGAHATGEQAEDVLESRVSEYLIEQHEEKSKLFYLLSMISGAVSAVALVLQMKGKTALRNYLVYAILLLNAVNVYFAWQTGVSGGAISHPEIRTEQIPAAAAGQSEDRD